MEWGVAKDCGLGGGKGCLSDLAAVVVVLTCRERCGYPIYFRTGCDCVCVYDFICLCVYVPVPVPVPPGVERPEDWDDEEEGVWQPPLIKNPKCIVSVCGVVW